MNPIKLNSSKPVGRAQLNEANFQQVPNILVNDIASGKLMHVDKTIYQVLLDHVRENAWCYPSLITIGRLAGCDKRTVSRALSRLEKAGHILRQGKSRCGTRLTYVYTRVINNKVQDGRIHKHSRATMKGQPHVSLDELFDKEVYDLKEDRFIDAPQKAEDIEIPRIDAGVRPEDSEAEISSNETADPDEDAF